jgi:RNA 3'-terminal phosphate cyclase (ATP)
MNFKPEQGEIIHVEGPGPGNAVSLFLEHENVTEVFVGLGQHGVRAESVGKGVAHQAQKYLPAKSATGDIKTGIGEHLADQLLLPMALLGGGVFTTTDITQHTHTNIDIIRRFLDVGIKLTQNGRKCWTVEIIN